VEAGKLYRAVTPLYIIRYKNKEYYCYSDEELEAWKRGHKTNAFDLLRAKGLGELNPADLQKVCFENEHYKRITVSDAKQTEALLETLMGSNVEPRKQYIYDNATSLGFNFD
jgi:DNA gyrase subunit B